MRTRDTIVLLSALFLALNSQAKTGKYKRPGSATTTTVDQAPTGDSKDPKATEAAKPTGSPAETGEKKVDLSDLENRYWTAKDTEFTVVQNRLYTKANKFSVMPLFGYVLSDPYTTTYNYGVAVNYYFSERHGVEMSGWKSSSQSTDLVKDFRNRFEAIPDHSLHRGYIGVNYNWIPIYAKLSLLEKKILYFDMSISPGIGVTFLESETFARPPITVAPPTNSQAPITLALDIAQQVFLNERFALRIEMRNHFFQERVYKAESAEVVRNKMTYYGAITFGITIFQ